MDRRPPPPDEPDLATNPLAPSAVPPLSEIDPPTSPADITPLQTHPALPPAADPPATNLAQISPISSDSVLPSVSSLGGGSVEDFFPRPNEEFLHFRVVEELGRGAFARVYLAKQATLANRLVAIKVTTAPTLEPQRLARLQHSNVVPVYSVHEAGRVQVVCMPFLGRTTLSHVIRALATGDGPRPSTGRALATALSGHWPKPDSPPPDELHDETRAALAGMSFVNGCLTILAHLAGGLGHAHERGILHRDLKPANVLITDDGTPMLLDFNVSVEAGPEGQNKRVGGTIPYMAPEQLRAYAGGNDVVDERSDLYGLGVILFELLTGRLPYPSGPVSHATIKGVIDRRAAPPPPVRELVPEVTPAVESIVVKLLAHDPAARYARADDLREDLRRQLANLPLAFAPDASVKERVTKWRRRNPRAATGLAVAFAATLFLVLPVALLLARQSRIEARAKQLQATEALVEFRAAVDDLRRAAVMLGSRTDPTAREAGLGFGKGVVGRYGMSDDADWEARPQFALLDPAKQAELKTAAAQVLVLMTRAELVRGANSPEALTAAEGWNALAAKLFPEDTRPGVVARHREEIAALRAGRPAPKLPPVSADSVADRDLYFDGLDLTTTDRFPEAVALLSRFCDNHPDHFLAWFARGLCHDTLGQPAEAATAFAACVSLRPDFPEAHFNRGVARLKMKRFADAEGDFTRALALKPDYTLALINRGIARHDQKKFRGATDDFTAALALPNTPTRVYFLRSLSRWPLPDQEGSTADRERGLKETPTDSVSWSTRGEWRLKEEPQKAVEDFDAALALNPYNKNALLNKAVALAEYLHRPADAIAPLTRLLAFDPDNAEARGSRGVYAARCGQTALARKDAADTLKLDASAYRTYQIAGLFAQLSKSDATGTAKADALTLLRQALRAGFDDMDTLKSDGDLDPIRATPEFRALLAAYEHFTLPKK